MATTKIWPVHDSLKRLVDYAGNPEKTEYSDLRQALHYAADPEKVSGEERMFFVTGINCEAGSAYEQMTAVKKRFGKENGNVAYHAYQSFKPGEVTPEECHAIGLELARELWGSDYQVLVATHLDRNHLHNHFLLNSVSFRTGKKFNCKKSVYDQMRKASDRLCQEHDLSVVKNPKGHTPRSLYFAEKNNEPTRYNLMREAIDFALESCIDYDQLKRALADQGYVLEANPKRKYATIRSIHGRKATRLYRLGEDYDIPAIVDRIENNRYRYAHDLRFRDYEPLQLDRRPRQRYYCIGNVKTAKKVGGLRGLYFHYCYRLGILPKGRGQPPLSPEMREACRQLDSITKQAQLLVEQKFETTEDVERFISQTNDSMAALTEKRQKCYNRLRRCTDTDEINTIKEERDRLTKALALFRQDAKTAQGILDRTAKMKSDLAAEEHLRRELTKPLRRRERSYER